MLAITSNWGLGDGSLADSRARRAAGWLEAVRRVVVRAGWGRDGRYVPPAAVTLLFAGDTFDWLLSDVWSGPDRPWHGGSRAEQARGRVALAAFRMARPVWQTLARWSRMGMVVPATTPRGRPSGWAEQRVGVNVVLLAGDRDTWLTDHAATARRLAVTVGEEWSDDRRHVRHGHDLDPLGYLPPTVMARGGRQPTLAESLLTDLVVRFAVAARSEPDFWACVRPRLATLAVRPPADWPALVSQMTGEHRQGEAVRSLWRRAVAAWHEAAVRELPACETEYDALAAVAAWLERSAGGEAVPEAIRRLSPERGQGSAIVAEPGGCGAPVVVCHRAEGEAWWEPLGGEPPDAAVIAVGLASHDAGGRFVDAA